VSGLSVVVETTELPTLGSVAVVAAFEIRPLGDGAAVLEAERIGSQNGIGAAVCIFGISED